MFWILRAAPLVLFGIGLTEAIRTYCVVLVPMSVGDLEGQFDTPRSEDLKAVALVGFEDFLGKFRVIVLIHFDYFFFSIQKHPRNILG